MTKHKTKIKNASACIALFDFTLMDSNRIYRVSREVYSEEPQCLNNRIFG